ncbi:hypothetical protein KUTeg_007393 [Tegillarca granosa]|uniref:Uncharacterized protein n=1 Tax=Tegillarca granosa TaxID=220873 RepID=A0ABQ9FD51_TEGGR|nr:hypothetical protein KUTeg_007393 [Tegillarca granosa]
MTSVAPYPVMDDLNSGSEGRFKTLLDVSGGGDKKRDMEMSNLLNEGGDLPSPEAQGDVPAPAMKRVESSELLNLTLHQSARNGDVRSTRILLQTMGGNVKKKINLRDEDDLTPLHYAARYNHLEVLNVNGIPTSESTDELSAHHNTVAYLVKHGAKINIEDKYGLTPLHYAAMRGNEAADKQGMTALHMASTHNTVEIARMLIEAGAKLRCQDNEDLTPLHCSAAEGNLDIVKLLFEAGAQADGWVTINNMVTDRDCDSNTCLHVAVENGHYDVVKLCIAKRADVNTPCKHHMNPIHLAAKAGDVRIVRLLVDNNARIDALNEEQQTPLHIAAAFNHCEGSTDKP